MKETIVLGVDIGGTKTVISAINADGVPFQRCKYSSTKLFKFGLPVAESLAVQVQKCCKDWNIRLDSLRGVVVGIPGLVDRTTGVITSCPNLPELEGIFLANLLAEKLQVLVRVENDVNLLTLGEQAQGAGKGVRDLVCIYVGTGIGGGLILNGQLYTGADGAAGEPGHVIIQPGGRKCTCGSKGCLEMYCSGKALALQAPVIFGMQDEISEASLDLLEWNQAEEVIKAARSGHQLALKAVEDAFYYLGLGVVNMAGILNPRLVLLGGGILSGWPDGLEIVRRTVRENARQPIKDLLQVGLTSLDEQASSIGAFSLLNSTTREYL